tara:strand:+ start:200 stop:655 length:456 start_codon:yes stop_codon:yes gene_type:complete
MAELKKSVVKSVRFEEMFNELYKFDVSFEDGTNGKMYKKGDNPYIKEGDEVMYSINSKGTIKIIPKGQENSSFTPAPKNTDQVLMKDKIIMLQVMFKASSEFHAGREKSTESDVSKSATNWYETAMGLLKDPNVKQEPVIEKTPLTDDVPF